MLFPKEVILSLFLWYIEDHFICLLFIYLLVCACACTVWSVMCVCTQNSNQYYVMTLKLLSLISTNQPVRTAIIDKTERQCCIECWQNVLIKRYVQRNFTCHKEKRRFLLIQEATNRTAYRWMNAIVAQPKNCPFWKYKTTNEVENITTESNNNVILLYLFW